MGKKRPGVKERESSIQVWFNYEGKRCWETLDWFPSETNLDKAGRLRKRIKTLIDADAFSYAEFFPDSQRAKAEKRPVRFFDVAIEWLETLSVLDDTKRDYKRILNRHWDALFPIAIYEVEYAHISRCISDTNLNERSAKYFNNEIAPLKSVFKYAKKMKYISENPCDELDSRRNVKAPPDPFERDEIEKITNYFYKTSEWGNYFEAAFFMGLRNPSEIIALPISNIDFSKNYARIDQVVSRCTKKNHTKTRVIRDVHLNPRAAQALRMARKNHPTGEGPIFRQPSSGDAILTGNVQNDLWKSALANLGIRHRPMKNTRHSYATFLLEEGVNPAIAASQLGHSVQMFLTTYAKWINKQKTQEEFNKIDAGAGQRVANSVANAATESAKSLILK